MSDQAASRCDDYDNIPGPDLSTDLFKLSVTPSMLQTNNGDHPAIKRNRTKNPIGNEQHANGKREEKTA